jgi:hypothetical protein
MGVLAATVRFTAPIPTSAELVAALCQHTGEVVSYKEEVYQLNCPALKEAGSVFAVDDPQASEWEMRTGRKMDGYLWYATLVVLTKLGGEQVGFQNELMLSMPAPTWAYKPWQFARKQYRWRKWRKYPWITLDEARRLGVE